MSNERSDNIEPTGGPDSRRSSRRMAAAHPPIEEIVLQRYLDGRVEGRDRLVLEDALRTDAIARRTLDALREEARLIREALETQAEPSRRLGDKILATLHNEERFHLHALRSRRLRRQIFLVAGAAAAVFLCLWLVKPREAAGSALSGTPATLAPRGGERRPLQKGMRLYEGDQISTALGQFVRLTLGDVVLDLDENSKLVIAKSPPAPAVRLESGRMGVDATAAQQDFPVVAVAREYGGAFTRGSRGDVWLPADTGAVWPSLLVPEPGVAAEEEERRRPEKVIAVVTVLRGSFYYCGEGKSRADRGEQALLEPEADPRTGATRWRLRCIHLSASHVAPARDERSWHSFDGVAPREWVALGALELPGFAALGQRLGLMENEAAPVTRALRQLEEAALLPAPAARAGKLAAGQQALRTACEAFKESEDRWHYGRMLEGVAQLRRGRALLEADAAGNGGAAYEAFDAARVAFEEALQEPAAPGPQPLTRDEPPAWTRAFGPERTPKLEALSPTDQAALLATFLHPIALYWEAMTQPPAAAAAGAPAANKAALGEKVAQECAALRGELGHSVESLAARLAEALAVEISDGGTDRAADALLDVIAFSLDGSGPEARREADGVKQAALLNLVKLYAAGAEKEKARQAAEDFAILFPLDAASPAGREILKLTADNKQ